LNKKSKQPDSDQKVWEEFVKNPVNIDDKDNFQSENNLKKNYKFDFHGYSIQQANLKISKIIPECYEKGINEILVITGKGIHSTENQNVYSSLDLNKLKNTIPDFIKNNIDLASKIQNIKQAPRELGGEGALIIKIKKL